MRCYVKKDKDMFIEKYGVLDDYILILYGDKHIETKKYTVEEEKYLLEKMKKQILNENYSKKLNDSLKCTIAGIIGSMIYGYPYINELVNGNKMPIGVSFLSIFLALNLFSLPSLIMNNSDFNKNMNFINNKETYLKFNQFNPNYLEKVSGKAKRKIRESLKENPLNINFINNISKKDLNQIKENIEEKSMVLKRRY